MFRIYDGRDYFYQWDIDRKIIVNDKTVTEVHFCNRTDDCSLICEVYSEGNLRVVNVPNILLQDNWRINVYAYDGNYTKHATKFEVKSRTKPADYVYTETEIKNYDDLAERLDQIEKNGISDAAINGAIERYLDENGIDVDVDLTGYATEEYVDKAIENIDLPSGGGFIAQPEAPTDKTLLWIDTDDDEEDLGGGNVDLTDYATKDYVDSAVSNVDIDLTPYALKTEIPSIEGLATEQYVNNAIANIDIPGGGGVGGGARLVSSVTVAEEVSAISLPLPADEDWWIGDHKYTLMVTGTIGATTPTLISLSPNSTADFGSTGVVRMLNVKANANQEFMVAAEIYKMGKITYSHASLAQRYDCGVYPRAISWSVPNTSGGLKSLNFVFQTDGATMLNTTIKLWEVF